MKLLVTGAAGFLGSSLCSRLIQNGHTVVGLDDFSTGNIQNVNHLSSTGRFSLISGDVREPYDFDGDAILNFACPASPVQYQSNPVKTLETSVLGMTNALRLAQKRGLRVVQASTSEVYGDPEVSPQNETYWGNVNPIGIRSCYDEGKRAAETLCFDYKRQFSVDARVIRIFNTYGPKMQINDGRVVSNFIVQALQNKDITVYGNGEQTRSFCYVDDLISGIVEILMHPAEISTPINLGNDREFTIRELAEMVIAITKSKSNLVFSALPSDDPMQRKPDLTLMKRFSSWEPQVQVEEGISLTADYFKKILLAR
jgi:UDP-glucuronate decarboxylase